MLGGGQVVSRQLIAALCGAFVFLGAGAARAETDVEKAGSFNPCLQRWVNEHKLQWKTQEFTKGGDHTVTYEDGSVAVEHPDGSVDLQKDENGRKVWKRVCHPQPKTATPPPPPPPPPPPATTPKPTTPPDESGPGGVEIPPGPGELTPKEEALLKCATPDEVDMIRAYQRAIEALQRQLEIVNKPVEEAEAEATRATDEAYAYRTSVSEEQARDPAFQQRLNELEDKANEARARAFKAKQDVQDRINEINNHINDTDQEMRQLLQEIEARGDCPPPGKTETPPPTGGSGSGGTSTGGGTTAKPGPGLPVPGKPFVMPKLPDCFEDEDARKAFDDMVYELFLEQINASSLAPTPEARDEARRNVDALDKLRAQISAVPYCPAKRDNSHASNPDALKDILGHVTIGVGVGAGGGHDDHHGGHDNHDSHDATKPGD